MNPRKASGSPIPPLRNVMGIILFISVMVLLMILWRGIELLTDWFWFQEVGYQTIFSVTVLFESLYPFSGSLDPDHRSRVAGTDH